MALAAGLGLPGLQRLASAQAPATLRRIGVVTIGAPAAGATEDPFKAGMRDLGWVEGRNIEYRTAYAHGDTNRLDALVRELLAQQVEVIVTSSAVSTRAAQRVTKTVPIVMTFSVDAVGNALVASLARPGGNITGISNQLEDVFGKLIENLHTIAPQAGRMAFLLNESNPSHAAYWAAAQRTCSRLGLLAQRTTANAPGGFGAAVAHVMAQRAQAVVVHADPVFSAQRSLLHDKLRPAKLPVAFSLREDVLAGGLLSYGPDLSASFRYAAKYVDKILQGAKPADLPVEQPTKFDLVINLKTANALGLTVPPSLLLRADEVIQ
jgi:putative tryptophan/tyrosine transport system substrate-binding protein